MEKRERHLSRRKSSGKPRWNRGKSLKRSSDGAQQAAEDRAPTTPQATMEMVRDKGKAREIEERPMFEDERPTVESGHSFQQASVIPDAGPHLWEDRPPPSSTTFKTRYTIHNPLGPRWYKNYHLIPPQSRLPSSSSFSPSFPPMGATSGLGRAEDAGRKPGPSRTPSGSPLPTPNSSQTRITDGAPGMRSRKVSQTAHDGVDLLDGTDPWGTNWHHQSPYDIGLNPSQVNIPPSASDVSSPSTFNVQRLICRQ